MAGNKKTDTNPSATETSPLEFDPPEQIDPVDILKNRDL
ncbi:hypothetical protein SLEP1_g60024, partial [Rubroshorea leprosula]